MSPRGEARRHLIGQSAREFRGEAIFQHHDSHVWVPLRDLGHATDRMPAKDRLPWDGRAEDSFLRPWRLRQALVVKPAPDPGIRVCEAIIEPSPWLPIQHLTQTAIIAISAPDALRLGDIVLLLEVLSRDPADEVDQLVDRHEMLRSQVDRLPVVGVHDPGQPLDAVPNVAETARLLAVPPDLDRRALLRLRDFSADRGGGLLPASPLGPPWAGDVVGADHRDSQAVGFPVGRRGVLRRPALPPR